MNMEDRRLKIEDRSFFRMEHRIGFIVLKKFLLSFDIGIN